MRVDIDEGLYQKKYFGQQICNFDTRQNTSHTIFDQGLDFQNLARSGRNVFLLTGRVE